MKEARDHKMKILIVEDNAQQRMLLEEVARMSGCEATACADGETALEAFRREGHTLLILDWKLPGMSGLELCRRIRGSPGGDGCLILMMTGFDQPEVREEAIEAGADDYLVKPVSLKWLQVRLMIAERQVFNLTARLKAERELQETLADLEDRVQARTAELRDANESLRREIAEREQVERELRQAQAQLLRSEKLASLGTLVSGAAHEILNPLNILSMHLQMAGKSFLTDTPEILRERTAIMKEQVGRIDRIVGGLIDFAKQRGPKLAPLDVRETLDRVVDLVVTAYRKCGVEILRDFAEDIPCIRGDREQLSQVFLQLCVNAKDAMPDGGRITLRVRPCEREGSPWVRVEVEDTGTGIPEEIQDRIFDPFFTTKPEGKGTGLGLSTTYGIVETHHGKLSAISGGKRGTTFRVELPAIEGEEKA